MQIINPHFQTHFLHFSENKQTGGFRFSECFTVRVKTSVRPVCFGSDWIRLRQDVQETRSICRADGRSEGASVWIQQKKSGLGFSWPRCLKGAESSRHWKRGRLNQNTREHSEDQTGGQKEGTLVSLTTSHVGGQRWPSLKQNDILNVSCLNERGH